VYFRGWRFYLWLADCLAFVCVGYLATVAAFLEFFSDRLEATAALYAQLNDLNGALSEEDLATIRSQAVPAESRGDTCGVCLCDIEVLSIQTDELELKMPQCRHAFHCDCIVNWLSTKAVCPMCKVDIRV
jgi:hypothetical protein